MAWQQPPGGRRPDDPFDEISRYFDKAMELIKGRTSFVALGVGFLFVAIGVLSSFYTVEPNEEAVVVRLGRYSSTQLPGLHFKIPFGIDKVVKVKTKLVHQEEFGFRTTNTQNYSNSSYTTSKSNFQEESLMLTGDLNVADVEWIVQYRINEPKKFLFHARDPIRNIRDVTQSIMRRVVGDRLVNAVLTTGRVEIALEATRLIQEVLNKYDIGIGDISVKLQDVNPPEVVKPSFNEVNAAKQEQEKAINQAEEAYNKVIPEARGKAEKMVSESQGYADGHINRAKGDADKFNEVLMAYRVAPNVTKKRLYLETIEELFGRFERVTIVDERVKGLLPIFSSGQNPLDSKKVEDE